MPFTSTTCNLFFTALTNRQTFFVVILLLTVGSSLTFTRPVYSSEQEILAAERKKNDLKASYEECMGNLDRWKIENVEGPKLLERLEAARNSKNEDSDAQTLEQLKAKRKELKEQWWQLQKAHIAKQSEAKDAWQRVHDAEYQMAKMDEACDQGDKKACDSSANIWKNVLPPRVKKADRLSKEEKQLQEQQKRVSDQLTDIRMSIDEFEIKDKKDDAARERVAELLAQGYHLNKGGDIGMASYHVLERQCEELRRQYEGMLEYYLDLANAEAAEFEDSREIQFGLTTNQIEEIQYGEYCDRLLVEFNGAKTINAKWAVLQRATQCDWYGVGFDFVTFYQNHPDSTANQNQGQQVRPGALTVIKNPYPNPYMNMPHPYMNQPIKRPNIYQGVYETPPPKNNTRKKPDKQKDKEKPTKPNYSGGGEAFGY